MTNVAESGGDTYYIHGLACYWHSFPKQLGEWEGLCRYLADLCCRQEVNREYDVGPWLALCDLLEEAGVASSLRSEVVKVFNLGKSSSS